MLHDIITIIIFAIVTESIVELVTTGSIFFSIRNWIAKKPYLSFVHDLISCGYCFSVWVSGLVTLAYQITFCDMIVIDYLITLFLVHRLSNLVHELFSRWFGRLPFTLFFTLNNKRKK